MKYRSLSALVVLLACSACVPAARYEEAASAARVEQEANRRMLARLHALESQLEKADKGLTTRQSQIDERDKALAESELASNVAKQEREQSDELVEQLRGELGRVGDHLRVFSDQKRNLAEALEAAEKRSKELSALEKSSAELVGVTRDLTTLMHAEIATGDVDLSLSGSELVLSAARSNQAKQLESKQNVALLAAVARVMKLHPGTKLALKLRASDGDDSATLASSIGDALSGQGVEASRQAAVVSDEQGEPGRLVFAFSAAP